MELPHCHDYTTNYIPCIYTPTLQSPRAVIYYWSEHRYVYINCSGLDPKNHMFCLDSIHVYGMSNELVSKWYETTSICVIAYLDSAASYVHYLS